MLNDSDQELTFSGCLSPHDYGSGLYLHHRPPRWIGIVKPALVGGYVIAIALHGVHIFSGLSIVVLIFPLVLLLVWRAAWFETQLHLYFLRNIGLSQDYRFLLTPEEIQISSGKESSTYPWSSFCHYKRNRQVTVLYLADHEFFLIPNRWLPSLEAKVWFHHQLDTHLGVPSW